MMLSVLIPSFGRPELLDRCLRTLSMQAVAGFDVEVIVGVDGEDRGEVASANRWSSGEIPMRALPGPHAGPAATRNRIVREAAGETLLFLNDDVEASSGLFAAHAKAQEELLGQPAMVLGSAPWAIEEPDRVIDRLTRETSLIFFYDQMTGAAADDPSHDWGWRHAWTLNLSLPARCVREVGGFCESMRRPVYEDIELAFRVRERFGAPTLYRPGAEVLHRHKYEPIALLAREYVLGHQSRRLAEVSPGCARELFRDDPMDDASIDAAVRLVSGSREEASALIGWFATEAVAPASMRSGDAIQETYAGYVRCRTYLRSIGLMDAGRGLACEAPIGWLTELTAPAAAHG